MFLKVSPCYTFIFQRPRGITESCVDMSGYLSPAFNKLGRKSAVSSQQKTEEKKQKTKRKRASDGRELPSRAILISDTIRIDQTLKDWRIMQTNHDFKQLAHNTGDNDHSPYLTLSLLPNGSDWGIKKTICKLIHRH